MEPKLRLRLLTFILVLNIAPVFASEVAQGLIHSLSKDIESRSTRLSSSECHSTAKMLYLRYQFLLNTEADRFGIPESKEWVAKVVALGKYSDTGKDLGSARKRLIDLAGLRSILALEAAMPRVHPGKSDLPDAPPSLRQETVGDFENRKF